MIKLKYEVFSRQEVSMAIEKFGRCVVSDALMMKTLEFADKVYEKKKLFETAIRNISENRGMEKIQGGYQFPKGMSEEDRQAINKEIADKTKETFQINKNKFKIDKTFLSKGNLLPADVIALGDFIEYKHLFKADKEEKK